MWGPFKEIIISEQENIINDFCNYQIKQERGHTHKADATRNAQHHPPDAPQELTLQVVAHLKIGVCVKTF